MDQTSTESTLGILRYVGGYTYDVVYDLVFTTQRVIAVILKHPEDRRPYQYPNLSSLLLGNWNSRHKEQTEQLKLADQRRQAMTGLTPEELLELNGHNFEIRYDRIESVRIKRSLLETKLRFVMGIPGQVKRQRDFTIKKQQVPETEQLLDKTIKSKVKG